MFSSTDRQSRIGSASEQALLVWAAAIHGRANRPTTRFAPAHPGPSLLFSSTDRQSRLGSASEQALLAWAAAIHGRGNRPNTRFAPPAPPSPLPRLAHARCLRGG